MVRCPYFDPNPNADKVHAAAAATALPPQTERQLEQLSCVCSTLVGRERLKGAGAGAAVRALCCWGAGAHRVVAYWAALARLLACRGLLVSTALPPTEVRVRARARVS